MIRKHIRSIIITLALIFTSLAASAQFHYAVQVGVDVPKFSFKQDIVGTSQIASFNAGVVSELIFPGIGFGIDTGILYNQTGGKVNLGEKLVWSSLGYQNETTRIHNIYIPLHLRFKYSYLYDFQDIVAPFAYAGPEFQIQVGHSGCGNPYNFSGGDLGLGVGLGAELYHKWQISASYTFGMTYVLKTKLLDNFSSRCSFWSVKVAYFFK